jgi:hypothetical protein
MAYSLHQHLQRISAGSLIVQCPLRLQLVDLVVYPLGLQLGNRIYASYMGIGHTAFSQAISDIGYCIISGYFIETLIGTYSPEHSHK